jgi:hypothetical protein
VTGKVQKPDKSISLENRILHEVASENRERYDRNASKEESSTYDQT